MSGSGTGGLGRSVGGAGAVGSAALRARPPWREWWRGLPDKFWCAAKACRSVGLLLCTMADGRQQRAGTAQ